MDGCEQIRNALEAVFLTTSPECLPLYTQLRKILIVKLLTEMESNPPGIKHFILQGLNTVSKCTIEYIDISVILNNAN